MATALGYRYLVRFHDGTATREQLDAALARGWVTEDEHDQAVDGQAPGPYAEG